MSGVSFSPSDILLTCAPKSRSSKAHQLTDSQEFTLCILRFNSIMLTCTDWNMCNILQFSHSVNIHFKQPY